MEGGRPWGERFRIAGSGLAALVLAIAIWNLICATWIYDSPPIRRGPDGKVLRLAGRYVRSHEGYVTTYINADGLRRRPRTKPAARTIVVLGDSITQGMQVADGDTYCSLTEAALRKRGDDVEVVNLGASGTCPVEYIQRAENVLQEFAPERVVVQISEADFTVDYNRHRVNLGPNAGADPEGVDEPGTFTTLRLGPAGPVFNTPLAQFLNFRRVTRGGSALRARVDPVKEELIDEAIRDLKHAYPVLTILFLPRFDYFADSPSASHPFHDSLRSICERHGVDLVDLQTPFEQTFRLRQKALHGFPNTPPGGGHLNETGHRVVADALIERLGSELPR